MATNPKEYVNLRTLLDSLEVGALRFYLSGTGSQPKKFKLLKDKLMPLIDELWNPPQETQKPGTMKQRTKKPGIDIDCPDGYFDCEGCCVPYRCPDLSSLKPKPRAGSKRKR